MTKLWLYYTLIFLLFVAPSYAVTTEDTPHIPDTPKISFIGDERIDGLVQIAYDKCIDVLGDKGNDDKRYYSCVNMVLTFDSENGAWDKTRVSATDDRGLCMLHKRRHKDFINSQEFQNDEAQLEYCVGVRQNAMERGKMPRVAYSKKENMRNRFIIQK